jgi:Skp family chaperone for outer membrane proteins
MILVEVTMREILIWLLAFSMSLSLAVFSAEPIKIGFVNFDVAFQEELEAQKYTKELENEERQIMDGEQKARADIEAKMGNFKSSVSKLSEKARLEKETALSNEIATLQQQFNQRRLELNQKRQHILQDLENKNRLLLESVSRQGKYDLVLNAAAIVFASNEIKNNDLTKTLVAKYNEAFSVKPEAPKKAIPSKKK